MSANKYANLPDIDTAPDIYETEDSIPSTQTIKGDGSDDEAAPPPRSARGKADGTSKEEIDSGNLISLEEANKRFKKAERRRNHIQTHYAYPPSPTSLSPLTGSPANPRPLSLSHRLRALQSELSILEAELADPSNPLLAKEREDDHVDPGQLIRGLVDVRARLDKIRKGKEGRGKLVNVVLGDGRGLESSDNKDKDRGDTYTDTLEDMGSKSDLRNMLDIDRRVGELEKMVGSSTAALDESSPLPPPLLPLITRLNAQSALLTQPRHIDSISRRLKLLLSDLDRASTQHHSHRRHPSQPTPASQTSQIQEQVLPLLSRLGPSLPHIPHILTRLRTLSALHASAAEFQATLNNLEGDQQKTHQGLTELQGAIESVEKSLQDNQGVVRRNVAGLESRVEILLGRLEELSRTGKN